MGTGMQRGYHGNKDPGKFHHGLSGVTGMILRSGIKGEGPKISGW